MANIILIPCEHSVLFSRQISKYLPSAELGQMPSSHFSNGETNVNINVNIRRKHAVIVCSIKTGNVNNDFMEALLIIDACCRADVDKITLVMPYYPYSRSDKKDKPRVPIAAAMVANMLQNYTKLENVICVDLHSGQEQGFFSQGFHNLFAINYLCKYINDNYLHTNIAKKDFVLVSPDAGSIKRIKEYARRLHMPYVILEKQRNYEQMNVVENSIIIGDIATFLNKTGIIIDDMADTMGTMISAINELVSHGIKDVIVVVTHGILSGPAFDNIANCPYIRKVIVTNSVPLTDTVFDKIAVVDISELIAKTINCIETGDSISDLFK